MINDDQGICVDGFCHAWRQARTAARCPGSIPRDYWRTAMRNLVHAGMPERIVMKLSGHKTAAWAIVIMSSAIERPAGPAASRQGHPGRQTSPSVAFFRRRESAKSFGNPRTVRWLSGRKRRFAKPL